MKIVSLAPSNTEILYKLGLEDQVVATTSLCNYPERVKEKPSIGGWTNPKIERVKRFDPDLVVASDDLQDQAVEKLRDEGLQVLQVKPHSLEEVYQSFRKIGAELDREEEAESLVEELRDGLEQIDIKGARLYCEEWMDPPMASGNWIPGLVEKINGKYFLEDGERSRKFDLEELKKFDPEYIFMNICGAGENLSTQQINKREEWSEIQAVKKDEIYVVDDAVFNRPGPRLLDAARTIERIINNGNS